MNRKKRNARSSRRNVTTIALLAAAVVLLLGSMAGSSQAALTYFSQNYSAQITVSDIGITLLENGADVSWRNYTGADDQWEETTGVLLSGLIDAEAGETVQLGYGYPEELTVRNTGSIDQYARVTVYRYWIDSEGKKTELSPRLIGLHFLAGDTDSGWVIDEEASTPERTVLYYTRILKAGETAPAFTDTLSLDPALAEKVTETRTTDENGYTVITTTFDYDGIQFVVEAEADAVQTHNAREAIKSAWGIDVTVEADGSLAWNGQDGR